MYFIMHVYICMCVYVYDGVGASVRGLLSPSYPVVLFHYIFSLSIDHLPPAI